jgi:hypothetical protein
MARPPPLRPRPPPHEVVDISSLDGSTESDGLWWEKDPAYDQLRGRTYMKATQNEKWKYYKLHKRVNAKAAMGD